MIPQLSSSPHAHDHSSVTRIMSHVCIALLPCTALSIFVFGWPAFYLFVVTVFSGLGWELLCLKLQRKSLSFIKDYSALVTSWLVALTLPPWAPWWIGVAGSFIAVVVAKHIYGGIGQNVFNPAMVARVALLISFPVHLTTWPDPSHSELSLNPSEALMITSGLAPIPDSYTGATILSEVKTSLSMGISAEHTIAENFDPLNAALGLVAGSLGETSALMILIGGLWLLAMRVISWHIPLSMLGTVTVCSAISYLIDPSAYAPPSVHLLSGGIMLGAFFIATDPVTSPSSKGGQLIFGVGCGLIDFIIRTWGAFPEGIGFAVLFMNALSPLIDIYFRPRIYGRSYDGSPKTYTTTDDLVSSLEVAKHQITASEKGEHQL